MKHKISRLVTIAKEYNISVSELVHFLKSKGHRVENDPMVKFSYEIFLLLESEFKRKKVGKQSKDRTTSETKPIKTNITFEKEKNELSKPVSTTVVIGESNNQSKSTLDINGGVRLSKIAKELNVSTKVIVSFLESKGIKAQNNPMARIPHEAYQLLSNEFLKNSKENQEEKQEIVLNAKHKKEVFFIPFSDLKFQNGKVVFRKWLWQNSETVDIFISNQHIRAEFDSVKNFFQKALDIIDIKVEISFNISGLSVKSLEAYSPDIAKIDSHLIEAVRVNEIKKITKSKSLQSNSYTVGGIQEQSGGTEGFLNVFYKQDIELLNDILTVQSTKHRSHLEYLAFKQSKAEKLRFLFKPFSFIFLLEGKNQFNIIWETLDTSEATYIWPIEKNSSTLLSDFNKIEAVILSIKQGGKMAYIGSTNHKFRRIYHDYSEISNGFPKWRLELEAIVQ